MTVEQGFVAAMLGATAVTDIVGSKVRPNRIPQKESAPAIVYQRISAPREIALDGPVSSVEVRLRVDCWHTSYGGAKALGAAVEATLNAIGVGGNLMLGSEPIHAVYMIDDGDLSDYDGDDKDERVTQDWIVVTE